MEYSRTIGGRPDFIGGIDNEALDFGQLESFIHVQQNAVLAAGNPPLASTTVNNNVSTPLSSISLGTHSPASGSHPSHLPESPPDSGSEPPYSPGDLHGLVALNVTSSNLLTEIHHHGTTPVMQQLTTVAPATDPINSDIDVTTEVTTIPSPLLNSLHHRATAGLYMKAEIDSAATSVVVNSDELIQQQSSTLLSLGSPHPRHTGLSGSYHGSDMASPPLLGMTSVPQTIIADDITRLMPMADVYQATTTPNHRKRKLSKPEIGGTPSSIVKPEPVALSPMMTSSIEPPSPNSTGSSNGSVGTIQLSQLADTSSVDTSSQQNSDSGDTCPLQCIRFSPFQQQNWHVLCDQSLQELPIPHYRVDADKGFNFSNSDDAFVCQKKNHFQITCHAQLQGTAIFVRTTSGLEKIKSFHLHFYGVKLEAPTQTIRVEQSQSDRSKKPFHPVLIDLQNRQVSKVTVGRLHFSETTSNNMRKKGRPNPEQRYFQLVVGLHAHTHSGHFPVISQGSERIIVRASNPGQFESDVELCWQRGVTQDSIYHAGRVGINTDRPDESLVVHGNLKVSGHIVQPSDSRAKQEIGELNTAQQLRNVQRIRVVKYRYEPEFAVHSGLAASTRDCDEVVDTGVIAQEIREVLPDAVKEAGSIRLPNGQVIDNFLFVNKDRIYMENIGAVKELCKVTGSLETRIAQLEKINQRLVRIQKISGKDSHNKCKDMDCSGCSTDEPEACSNKMIQIIIVVLVFIMAVCLAAISTLYFVEHHKQSDHFYHVGHTAFGSQLGIDAIGSNGDPDPYERKVETKSRLVDHHLPYRLTTTRAFAALYPSDHDQDSQSQVASTNRHHSVPFVEEKLNKKTKNAKTAAAPELATGGTVGGVEETSDTEQKSLKTTGVGQVNGATTGLELSWQQTGAEHGYLLTDVDSNLIDTGQMKKNESKTEPLTSIKTSRNVDQQDIDLQNLLNTSDPDNQLISRSRSEPEYRERRLVQPIGMPERCASDSFCKSSCCGSTNSPNTCTVEQQQTQQSDSLQFSSVNETTSKPILSVTGLDDERPVEIKESQPQRQSSIVSNSADVIAILLPELNVLPKRNEGVHSASPAECTQIDLDISTDTFNVTLGSEKICSRVGRTLNITYNVPLSRFMVERQFQLVLTSQTSLNWRLCSSRQSSGVRRAATTESPSNGSIEGRSQTDAVTSTAFSNSEAIKSNETKAKISVARSIFLVDVPTVGHFERQLDFRTIIGRNRDDVHTGLDACHLTSTSGPEDDSQSNGSVVDGQNSGSSKASDVQLIFYTINIFWDCN